MKVYDPKHTSWYLDIPTKKEDNIKLVKLRYERQVRRGRKTLERGSDN